MSGALITHYVPSVSPGVEADVGAGHGPDDAHTVLSRHVGNVAQAGVI